MNYSNKFPHGIMFHHFHDQKKHKKTQGSINVDQLNKIIKYIGKKNILNPIDFIYNFKNNKLKNNHVCFTFDDSLKCQFDVALPLLEEKKIKAFFFVYSSIYDKEPDLLEIYRYFRTNYFTSIDEFYQEFFIRIPEDKKKLYKMKKKKFDYLKKNFKFYSDNDIKFRIFRDYILEKKKYKKIMFDLFKERHFDPSKFLNKIFLSKNNLKKLYKLNHQIGLHSHTHPTMINKLSFSEQKIEYKKNSDLLKKILNIQYFQSMSHPCGRYNNNTFKILKNLKIDIGFISLMKKNLSNNNYKYLIPRQDHSNIIKMIR